MKPSITAFSVASIVKHTQEHANNWNEFDVGFAREYARTGDPALAATIATAAMRLSLVVPSWAATWLADGLEKKIKSGTDLDTGLGFKRRDGGKGTSLESKRELQRDRDFIVFAMKLMTENFNNDEGEAAAYTATMLEKNYGKRLSTETILDRWNKELRAEARAMPVIAVHSPDE